MLDDEVLRANKLMSVTNYIVELCPRSEIVNFVETSSLFKKYEWITHFILF
jgi:hypothetical protein